jgi:hypothetical protein
MISEEKYKELSERLDLEIPIIRAVAEVESSGKGFLSTGEPIILFEPHIWWRQLVKHGLDPVKLSKDSELKTILYPKWGTYPYGKVSEQHARLQKATKVHRASALESASWGSFQICGFHYRSLGYPSIQAFINDAYKNEDQHLEMFARFVVAHNLLPFLQKKQWANFALRYNGAGYKKNKYDIRLAQAYKKYKQ